MSDAVQVTGVDEVTAYFETLGGGAHARLEAAVGLQTVAMQGVVMGDKLSGGVLNIRSGRLHDHIFSDVSSSGDRIVGMVYTNVPYARIHEYGGVIVPVAAPALRFWIGGQMIFAKSVTMPERSFLRSTLAERSDEIRAALLAAVMGAA